MYLSKVYLMDEVYHDTVYCLSILHVQITADSNIYRIVSIKYLIYRTERKAVLQHISLLHAYLDRRQSIIMRTVSI